MVWAVITERNLKMKCLIAMVAAALALAAVAQEPVQGKARRGQPGSVDPIVRAALNPKIAEKVGLTEEQQAKLKALEGDKGVLKGLQEKIRKGMDRQAELMAAEKIDEAAVMATMDDVFEARKEVAKFQMKRLIAVKAILTPEQVKATTEALKSLRGAKSDRKPGKRPQKAKPEAKTDA